jgi:hypothetical protein
MSRSLTGAYVESRFKALVDIAGGDAYVNGAPYSASGALGRANLSVLARVPNANKNEPSSLFAIQIQVPRVKANDTSDAIKIAEVPTINNGYTSNGNALTAPIVVPAGLTLLAASVAYGSLSAGTSATFGIKVRNNNNNVDQTVTTLAPATAQALTVLEPNLEGGLSWVYAQLLSITINGGGAADYMVDLVVTLICKSKHVA